MSMFDQEDMVEEPVDDREGLAYLRSVGWREGFLAHLRASDIDMNAMAEGARNGSYTETQVARQVGYSLPPSPSAAPAAQRATQRPPERPPERSHGRGQPQGQERPQATPYRAPSAPVLRTLEGTRGRKFYLWLREVLAYGLVTTVFLCVLYLSAKWTAVGFARAADFAKWTAFAEFLRHPIFGWIIPISLTAIQREFFPLERGEGFLGLRFRQDRGGPEILFFLVAVVLGVSMTVIGAQADLPQIEFVGLAWGGLLGVAILMEVLPEPFIEYFGGRLLMRLPFLDRLRAGVAWLRAKRDSRPQRSRA